MIINPTTGRLLQLTQILLRRSRLMAGWVPGDINRDIYVQLAVVGSVTARPH